MPVPLMAPTLRAHREASEPRPLLQAVPGIVKSRKTQRSTGEAAPRAADRRVAYDDLNRELLLAKERGQEVPCLGPGGEAWTSNDPIDQEIAADRCVDCPALFLCKRYAAAAGETGGTWGGETRDPARKLGQSPRAVARRRTAPLNDCGCLCGCGGLTKGGRYRPGHDSQHLKRLTVFVRAGAISMGRAVAALAESPRLQAKLLQRFEA